MNPSLVLNDESRMKRFQKVIKKKVFRVEMSEKYVLENSRGLLPNIMDNQEVKIDLNFAICISSLTWKIFFPGAVELVQKRIHI